MAENTKQYIPAYKGYITDVPELWFKRNDDRVFHFDQLTAFNASPNVNFTEVNAGWSLYPVAYLPGQSTMEMQATSGQFNAELFAMANGQVFEQKTIYIPYTATLDVKDNTATITDTNIVLNDTAHPVIVEGMEEAESGAGTVASGYFTVTAGAEGKGATIKVGSMDNEEGIATIDVTYYVLQTVKAIDIDNKSTAVGELIAKWPVYASGEEGNAAGIKGYLIMQVYKCRITQMPGFDTSYKSAANNSVTFSVVEDRVTKDKAAYTIAYYELPKTTAAVA